MNQNKLNTLKHFLKYCKTELNIQSLPPIKLISHKNWVAQCRSYGEYDPNTNQIKVFIAGRNLADICRSLVHELVHHRQMELNMIYNNAGETGTDIENEANALAGILMRDYGKLNLSVYDLDSLQKSEIKEAKQVGKLYHFTSYPNLIKIINNKFILTSQIQPYVSFTRNKMMYSDSISTQVRIIIDGTKLTNRYRLSPHADTKAGYGRISVDESEERISLIKYPNGVDISNCLLAIDLRKFNSKIDYTDPDTFQDSEDFVEPPSLKKYNELLKLLSQENIDYNLIDSYK